MDLSGETRTAAGVATEHNTESNERSTCLLGGCPLTGNSEGPRGQQPGHLTPPLPTAPPTSDVIRGHDVML